jgi:uncharacterized protein YgbK (DUF1537 family)
VNLDFQHIANSLPAIPESELLPIIKVVSQRLNKVIIVLDDDPTGTQTMHDVPVLTTWGEEAIELEIKNETPLFFILTNSRSLVADDANNLSTQIGNSIRKAFSKHNKEFIIVSRGDSTLRGHYPNEVIALCEALQIKNNHTAIIPAFFEGGRYTIRDTHYVNEGGQLTPVADTVFAKDKAFGFSNSNLKNWIEEKTNGRIVATDVVSFSIEELRTESIDYLKERIKSLPASSTIIVNAVAYYDLEKFALAYFYSGASVVFRTAASFVRALSATTAMPLLEREELVTDNSKNGGLIVAGSYVNKTTEQLEVLQQRYPIETIEIAVKELISGKNENQFQEILTKLNHLIAAGKDVLVFTSRQLVVTDNEGGNLSVNNKVSDFITRLVAELQVLPSYLIAKGGITSSDIATKALKIKRATVLGQVLPGVPVWKVGEESRFPGLSYIIFPGNVGDINALVTLYEKLRPKRDGSINQ